MWGTNSADANGCDHVCERDEGYWVRVGEGVGAGWDWRDAVLLEGVGEECGVGKFLLGGNC